MPDDNLGEHLDAFFERAQEWPVDAVAHDSVHDLSASVAAGVRRVQRRRRFLASGAAAVVVVAMTLTAAFVRPGHSGAPGVVGTNLSSHPTPSGSTRPDRSTAVPRPTTTPGNTFVDSQSAAPVASWASALHGEAVPLPAKLADSRRFQPVAIAGPHEVVGLARPAAGGAFGLYALVVIDPATAKVAATLLTGDDANAGGREPADHWTVAVSPDGATADWVAWASGHEGDDSAFSDITMYAHNLQTGVTLTLGTADSGETTTSGPAVGGDAAVWADDEGLHIYSLSQRTITRTIAVNKDQAWTRFTLRWPWLSYDVNGTYDSEGNVVVPPVPHLIDLRDGSDVVAPGVCDGTWCEADVDGRTSQLDTLALVGQGDQTKSRLIASDPGSSDEFMQAADGFVMWSDTENLYLYDSMAGRNIELPTTQNGVAYLSDHYVVWQESPADPTTDGPMWFADLDDLR